MESWLPPLCSAQLNGARTTTVYRPRQTHELEVLPRFHRFAFQEHAMPELAEHPHDGCRATYPSALMPLASRHRFNELTDVSQVTALASTTATTCEDGAQSLSVKTFRPRLPERQAAMQRASRAAHRYRAPATVADHGAPAGSPKDPVTPTTQALKEAASLCWATTAMSSPLTDAHPPSVFSMDVGPAAAAGKTSLRVAGRQGEHARWPTGTPIQTSALSQNGYYPVVAFGESEPGSLRGNLTSSPMFATTSVPTVPLEPLGCLASVSAAARITVRDPAVDAALEQLLPDTTVAAYFYEEKQRQQKPRVENAVSFPGGKEEERGGHVSRELPTARDPNVSAVQRLFAMQRANCTEDDEALSVISLDEDNEETPQLAERRAALARLRSPAPSPAMRTTTRPPSAADASAVVEVPGNSNRGMDATSARAMTGPLGLTQTLLDTRLVPHFTNWQPTPRPTAVLSLTDEPPHLDDRETAWDNAASAIVVSGDVPSASLPDTSEENVVVLSTLEETTRFLSAMRWLFYEEQYERSVIARLADAENPLPWLLESNLDAAAGFGESNTQPHCVLHSIPFTDDAVIHARLDKAFEDYRSRLVADRRRKGRGDDSDDDQPRQDSPQREAERQRRNQCDQERVFADALAEKEEAFRKSAQFRQTLTDMLALVAEEKRARLKLLGHFASCAWPTPCRCLRWDAEILEESAIPLEPTLSPVCVFVSTVLEGYAAVQETLLRERREELKLLREVSEMEFIALYVFDKLAADEARSFRHITLFHDYCMSVAARKGEAVPDRYHHINPLAVFENRISLDWSVEETVSARMQGMGRGATGAYAESVNGAAQVDAGDRDSVPPERDAGELDGNTPHDATPPTTPAEPPHHASPALETRAAMQPVGTPEEVPAAPLFLGPNDSPFCRLITFIDLYVVQSAGTDGRYAVMEEEALARHTMEQRLSFLRAAAMLEAQEATHRVSDVEEREQAQRVALMQACENETQEVEETLEERRQRRAELTRIRGALTDLVCLATTEHTKRSEEYLEAFTVLHQKEARARRWAQLRDRQQREGTGATVAAQWSLEQSMAALMEEEYGFRQKYFVAEMHERWHLEGGIRVAAAAFLAYDVIRCEEANAFANLMLAVFDEGRERLQVQQKYIVEQYTLFGKVVSFADDTSADVSDVDMDGSDESLCALSEEERNASRAGDATPPGRATDHPPKLTGGFHQFQRDVEGTPPRAVAGTRSLSQRPLGAGALRVDHVAKESRPKQSSPRGGGGALRVTMSARLSTSAYRRRRASRPFTVMTVLEDVPSHPLEGAISMQRMAVYNLHSFLPNEDLLDLFSV